MVSIDYDFYFRGAHILVRLFSYTALLDPGSEFSSVADFVHDDDFGKKAKNE